MAELLRLLRGMFIGTAVPDRVGREATPPGGWNQLPASGVQRGHPVSCLPRFLEGTAMQNIPRRW